MKYNTSLGENTDNALARLDELCSLGTLDFLAGLWDLDGGGFYSSYKMRKKRSETADFDSTAQVISFLSSGAIKGTRGKLPSLIADDIREKLAQFCATDPVRGKEIMKKLEVAEPTPSEKKKSNKKKESPPPTPEHLASEDGLVRYLDELWKADGSDAVGTVRDSLGKIKSAGLSDTLFAYLDGLCTRGEYPFNFSAERSSSTQASKLLSLYSDEGRSIPDTMGLAGRISDAISEDVRAVSISHIYGLWASLGATVKNASVGSDEENLEQIRLCAYIRERAVELLENTEKLLARHKRSDGGFAYFWDIPSDSDVNSTVTAVHGVRGNLFLSLGLTTPPLFEAEALEEMFDKMRIRGKTRRRSFLDIFRK